MVGARDWLYRNTRAPVSVVSWWGSLGATDVMTAVRLPGSMALSCAQARRRLRHVSWEQTGRDVA